MTGGSNGGMIKEIAKCFLKHGCRAVALMSRNAEKLQAVATELDAVSSSGQCIALQGDVRDFKSCSNVVSQVIEKY